MDRRWDDRAVEHGWCSHCVRRTEHQMKEKTWLPGMWRSVYECKSCRKRSVPCINECGAAAKGDWLWDDHFCLQCEGTIVSWPYPGGPWHETPGYEPPRAQPTRNRNVSGGRTTETLPPVDVALRGAQSSLEVLRDCLGASAEDSDMLRQVAAAARRDRDLLQKLIERTEDEAHLAQLLETHTELNVAIESYGTLFSSQASSDAAPAGSSAAALAAAERRLADTAARGRPGARAGGDASAPTQTPQGEAAQGSAPSPEAPASGWSAEARETFKGKMEQSLQDQATAPATKPFPVAAPRVNWRDGAEAEAAAGGRWPLSTEPSAADAAPAALQGSATGVGGEGGGEGAAGEGAAGEGAAGQRLLEEAAGGGAAAADEARAGEGGGGAGEGAKARMRKGDAEEAEELRRAMEASDGEAGRADA